MVRALLDGRKTQTRRVVKVIENPPHQNPEARLVHCWHVPDGFVWAYEDGEHISCRPAARCPYGKPGDRLWVRESTVVHASIREQLCGYRADGCNATEAFERNMPSIHMRRAHCRITLEVTEVRVQRLQEISEQDSIAEGSKIPLAQLPKSAQQAAWSEKHAFSHIWRAVNGADSWNENPWVWAVTFERVEVKAGQ